MLITVSLFHCGLSYRILLVLIIPAKDFLNINKEKLNVITSLRAARNCPVVNWFTIHIKSIRFDSSYRVLQPDIIHWSVCNTLMNDQRLIFAVKSSVQRSAWSCISSYNRISTYVSIYIIYFDVLLKKIYFLNYYFIIYIKNGTELKE